MPSTIAKQTPPKSKHESRNGIQSAWDMAGGMRVLMYGDSGSGKTTLWATWPGPILALICSGSSRPGELMSIDSPEYRKKIDARVVSHTSQYVKYLEDARNGNFKTVVLDHGSGLQDLTIKEIKGLDTVMLSKFKVAGKGETWAAVSRQEWGQSVIMMKELLWEFVSLPQNVIIVAQQRLLTDDEGTNSELLAPTIGASMSPAVVRFINPACDYIVQTYKRPRMRTIKNVVNGKEVPLAEGEEPIRVRGKGVDYCLRCEPHDLYTTKFRMLKERKPPDVIVDPTYDKIIRAIEGKPI